MSRQLVLTIMSFSAAGSLAACTFFSSVDFSGTYDCSGSCNHQFVVLQKLEAKYKVEMWFSKGTEKDEFVANADGNVLSFAAGLGTGVMTITETPSRVLWAATATNLFVENHSRLSRSKERNVQDNPITR